MTNIIKETFQEVAQAVFPLALAIGLLLILFVGISWNDLISFLIATAITAIGMSFFRHSFKVLC